jgi:hypothetical protein
LIPFEKGFCREEGIRTPDTLLYTRFPSVRLKPLGHLSKFLLKYTFFLERHFIYAAFACVSLQNKVASSIPTIGAAL